MKFLFFALTAAICLQGRLAEDAPPTDPSKKLEEFSQQASRILAEIGTQIKQVANAQNAQELTQILKTNADSFVTKVTDVAKVLQAQVGVDAVDPSSALGKALAKLDGTIAELRKKDLGGDVAKKTDEAQARLQSDLKTVVDEVGKVATKLDLTNDKTKEEEVDKLSKTAVEDALETLKKLRQQIREAADKKQ